jgi:hypothetical protein
MNQQKTYHIYLRDECLFKDLSESEFEVIWGRIYQTYFMEELSYSEITEDRKDKGELSEASY